MAVPDNNWRLSFQTKVLVPVIVVMAALVLITMWVMDSRIHTQMEAEATRRLTTAELVFENSQKIRVKNLLLRYRNVLNEPRIRATLQTHDPATIRSQLKDLLTESGVDSVLYLSESGAHVVGVTREGGLNWNEFEQSASASIRQALGDQANVDTIYVGEKLMEIVSIPGTVSGTPIGVLIIGTEIRNDVAMEFRELTDSEIVFIARDHVAGSTFPRPTLNPEFIALHHQGSGGDGVPSRNVLENQHYLWRAGHFNTLDGHQDLGYLLFSSYETSWQSFQETRKLLLWFSVLGILAGTGVVWVLTSRVTQPLRELRDGAESVGRGDFTRKVEVATNDECGDLARAFNQMTGNLNTSRTELEKTVDRLKAAQAQLFQREKLSAIGQFIAGVTHELNNPLTSVIGFAELLQQKDSDPGHKRFLDQIVSNARRCHRIVHSLLSFARQHAPERKLANLNKLVDTTLEFLQYDLRTSNIEVIRNLDPALPNVMADAHQLQQVFINLITNAAQAMKAHRKDGCLTITSEVLPTTVRFTFADNGPGIAPENLANVFDPFFTTKEVGKGTGLGLSLCYGIVQEHGGTISVRSDYGSGAVFVIELPIARESGDAVVAAPVANAVELSTEGRGKKVLAIDDEESILILIRETLTASGYEVQTVGNGEEALRLLAQARFDLILCDWKMPGLSGDQIYERLRATDPGAALRFLFMTGDVVNEKTRQYLDENGKTCLTKPFPTDEFRAIVRKMCQAGDGA